MLSDFLAQAIRRELPFEPTAGQQVCIEALGRFCAAQNDVRRLFLLRGYAGTGKTSVVSALVRAMRRMERDVVLLAPTGRAAKVFANYSGMSAYSIHKQIYRQKSVNEFVFALGFNKLKDAIFIVDEASMIGNSSDGSIFGSGRLLDDLVQYVYSGTQCSMVLVGDTAQLLPIGQNDAPALNADNMCGYGLLVDECELSEVVRQATESGILYNATMIRRCIENGNLPHLDTHFADVERITSDELIDSIETAYRAVGVENTIIITRSNKRANLYNNGVRAQVLQREDELSTGDLLMVTRNNYFWGRAYERLDFIANGDTAEVVRIGRYHELYGCRFVDATLRLAEHDMEIDACLLLDSLHTAMPADTVQLTRRLTDAVAEDYADIGSKRERYIKMRENPYLNALQIKFAYAVTCHKAQGGQWKYVFVDQALFSDEQLTPEFYQWLYTAFTRAQTKIYLVNFFDKLFI